MFYFIYGTDAASGRAKMKSLLKVMHTKRPDAETFRFHDENWDTGEFEALLHSQGLFDHKSIVILDNVFATGDARDTILSKLADMKISDNAFLILEGKTDKKTVDKIAKHAEKVFDFIGEEKTKAERFNTFALADTFGRRDKKALWVGLLKAFEEDISGEEIAGVLFWQAKNIILAKLTKSASESKLAPFADTKARGFAKNFSLEEIREKAQGLVEASVNAREGEGEMGVWLEKWVLSV